MRRRSLALPLLLVTFAACADGAPARPASEPIAEARDALSAIQQAKLLAADGQASDSFGTGVALDGDTAIVGAYQKSGAAGAAYVFVRSGAAWSQQAKLVAADPSPGDCFGISVSVSGDTALIGAYGKLNGGQTAGAAYVFTRSGAVWSQQAKLVPADNAAGDAFGISTALDGDTALIGAMWKNQTRGAAYVFARSGVMWSQQAKLVAADGQPDDQLGNAVALSGNLALIGAFHAGPKAPGSGAAYAFQRQGDVWSLDAKLFPADGAATDFFGYALALSGTSALVGAPNNSQAGFDAGATYAFDRSTGSWSPQAKLLASNAAAVDNFGRAIAMNASSAVIGAPLVQSFTGAAYLFTRASGGAWIEGPEMSAAAGQSDDRFGEYVALSGASALIGAWGDDEKAMSAGAAYVFALEGLEGTGGGASSSSGGGAGGSMTTGNGGNGGGTSTGGGMSTSSTSTTGVGGSASTTGVGGATTTSTATTGGAGGAGTTSSSEVSSTGSGGASTSEGGCGCRSARGAGEEAWGALLAAGAVGIGRRRSRRSPARSSVLPRR